MKSKIVSFMVSFLLLFSIEFSYCAEHTTSTSKTSASLSAKLILAKATTTTEKSNWWNKFGRPRYGGKITIRTTYINGGSFDPLAGPVPGIGGAGGFAANIWGEGLAIPDWTLDRREWSYPSSFAPLKFLKGLLLKSWEQTDPRTITVHLRQGIKWQNKPPVNGREITADDIVFNFDRLLGTGSGYSEPNFLYINRYSSIKKAVALDKYTVQFQQNNPGSIALYQILLGEMFFVPPEWVALGGPPSSGPPGDGPSKGGPPKGSLMAGGPLTKWENVVGSSPWILSDFVQGNKMVFSRNPDYWGYDERYPENRLPYADTLVELAIPDPATTLAALRTGKIDMWTDPMGSITWQQADNLKKTDPEIMQATQPKPSAVLFMRCDTAPFNDIKVRKALNMAIDRPTIAKSYFGGYSDGIPCGMVGPAIEGWYTPYSQWPKALQNEFKYNPAKSKELLTEAGYAGGFKTNVLAPSHQDLVLLELIKSQFMDIGVDMEIKVLDPPAFEAFKATGKQDQMIYQDGGAGMVVSPTISLSYLASATIPQMNSTFNSDAHYDELFNKISTAINPTEMEKYSASADLYAVKQHWMVPVMPTYTQIVAWQPWVKGYSGECLADCMWAGAMRARFWVDQSLKK